MELGKGFKPKTYLQKKIKFTPQGLYRTTLRGREKKVSLPNELCSPMRQISFHTDVVGLKSEHF